MTEEKPHVELGWPEIAAMIFAAQGITSGLWRVAVKVRFAAMMMQMPEDGNGTNAVALPTSVTALEAIAVFPAQEPGPMVFDAAALLSLTSRKSKSKTKGRPVAAPSTPKRIARSEHKPVAKPKKTVTAK
ncbi:MAG: hypothetical protein D4R79_13310 [Comamonadaceae bacterium]|nr:MAG: hypothetical protein D4R79_13310 [Comamonadaceae bacterium]